MRSQIRLGLFAMALVSGAVALVACDDDADEGAGTSTPAVTAAATAQPRPATTVPPQSPVPGTPGPAATLALTADPQRLACDGTQTSTITALVSDDAGRPVDDGTPVNFSVVTLGTIDPINATTTDGVATAILTPRAEGGGVVVNVTAGEAAEGLRVDCE
jgi:adhesin/invasin